MFTLKLRISYLTINEIHRRDCMNGILDVLTIKGYVNATDDHTVCIYINSLFINIKYYTEKNRVYELN